MDLAELERKLFAVARRNVPADRVPYAFEQRILARLKGRPVFDLWGEWSRALWRAAAPCVAIALLYGAWSLYSGNRAQNSDLSQQFENTVLAAADQVQAVDSGW